MYHYSINNVINDPTHSYTVTSASDINQRTQIWIMTPEGEILIKKFDQRKGNVDLDTITIESTDVSAAIKQVEQKTNILCSKDNLMPAYTLELNSEHLKVNGFILTLKLDPLHKEIIEDNFNGVFIDYKELANKFKGFKLDTNFKEALYNLIAVIDQRNTFFPSL